VPFVLLARHGAHAPETQRDRYGQGLRNLVNGALKKSKAQSMGPADEA
jgi:hypothetical protein